MPLPLPLNRDTIYQGTKLQLFLEKSIAKLEKTQRAALQKNITRATSTLASMCSGSGMAELVHHALFEYIGKQSNLFFSCEKVEWKQKHLRETVHRLVGHSDACVFADFAEINQPLSECAVHGRKCRVNFGSFLAIAGYSCKGMSSLIGKPRGEVLPKGEGSSGATCFALLDYLRVSGTPMVLLENVPEMGKSEEESKNVAYLHGQLRDLGYEVKNQTLKTSEYLLPQRRKRAWTIAIHLTAFSIDRTTAWNFLKEAFKVAESLQEPAMSLDEFFKLPTDQMVCDELKRRQECTRGEMGSKDYVKLHQETMAAKGLSWRTVKAPASVKKSQWFDLCPKREQEIVSYALAADPKMLSVDVGQRIDRCNITSGDVVATVTPGSKTYLMYPQKIAKKRVCMNRLMLGSEGLELQGFPVQLLPAAASEESSLSDPQMMDLAGNAFPSSVLAAMLIGIFTSLPSYDGKEVDEVEGGEDTSACDMSQLYDFLRDH